MKNTLFALTLVVSSHTFAQSAAHQAGKVLGEFGAGVGSGVAQGMQSMQPQWITIHPRSKQECIAESGGVLNTTYARCRNGRQELVRFDAKGNKIILSERSIPMR